MSDNLNQSAGNLQRGIQQEQDARDAARPASEESKEAVQTGQRSQPGPPLPAQHLDKPGSEARMQLKPRFLAPDYCGSGKLAGMVAIITGGDSGIGRAVAVLFAREGADVAIIYLNEHEDANETRRYVEAEGQSCLLIPGDVREQRFLPGKPSARSWTSSTISMCWSITPPSRSMPSLCSTCPKSASI